MLRCTQAGWKKIGITCSSGRRSLWFKIDIEEDRDPYRSSTIELCAGREGDDAYVKISREDFPLFDELLDVLLTAEYAKEN